LLGEAEQQQRVRETASDKPHITDGLLVAMQRLCARSGRQATTQSRHAYPLGSTMHAKHQVSEAP
jgi:hypothetical protein